MTLKVRGYVLRVYNVEFAVVSLVFIANCLGFVDAAAANVALTDRFGVGPVMAMGSMAQPKYVLEAAAPLFPVFVIGYAVNGFGISLQDAEANGYVASLAKGSATKMGIFLASRKPWRIVFTAGLDTVFPATAMVFPLPHVAGHSSSNTVFLIAVIHFRTQDECIIDIGHAPADHSEPNSEDNKYKQIFILRPLHTLAFFMSASSERMGGSSPSSSMSDRDGGPSSGCVSSGFFSELRLTLGQVALLWLNKLISERRAIFLYILLAIGLELIVWLVPSLIGGAVVVSFVGMLLGPVYPIVMNHAGCVLPPWLLTGCIGWIAGFGQAGSAFFPFFTGLLTSREGIKSLQPFWRLVSMTGFMVCLWALVPSTPHRFD